MTDNNPVLTSGDVRDLEQLTDASPEEILLVEQRVLAKLGGMPEKPLSVFSKGPWTFRETGQDFTGEQLDEAAFVAYRSRILPAAGEAGAVPVYQARQHVHAHGHWIDVNEAEYRGFQGRPNRFETRIVYAAPPAQPEKQAATPDIASNVINEACWKFIDAMPHKIPAPVWNNLKPAIYAAVCHVLDARPAPSQQAGADALSFLDIARQYCAVTETPSGDFQWSFRQCDMENFAAEVVSQNKSAAPAAQGDERTCGGCNGSGESTALSGGGPDAYDVSILCPKCGGTGAMAAAQGDDWKSFKASFAQRCINADQAAQGDERAVPLFADEGDFVSVPRGLLGAACYAIRTQKESPATLAELRRYTTGDLARQQGGQQHGGISTQNRPETRASTGSEGGGNGGQQGGGDAEDAERYRSFRAAVVNEDAQWLDLIDDHLTALGCTHENTPTADQVDAAFDAARAQRTEGENSDV